MRKTLLLRLNNPLQSFGVSADLYKQNLTAKAPTYSTILGIIANAKGMDREEDITDLAASYVMGSATLQPPLTMRDQQNAGVGDRRTQEEHLAWMKLPPTMKAKDKKMYEELLSMSLLPGVMRLETTIKEENGEITHQATMKRDPSSIQLEKHYLVGGDFLVALEAEEDVIEETYKALRYPARYLFIGRKNCPINSDFLHGVSNLSLVEALEETAIELLDAQDDLALPSVECVVPKHLTDRGSLITMRDYPLSWSTRNRKFAPRELRAYTLDH